MRPIPTDSHSGFRPLRIGALSLAGRRNTQGEEKIAAITESSVRFPCPPRTVVGVLLIAAIPRSPPRFERQFMRGVRQCREIWRASKPYGRVIDGVRSGGGWAAVDQRFG